MTAAGQVNLEVYTSPHTAAADDPEPALLARIASAKVSIVTSWYSATLAPVRDAMIAAKARGVICQIVMDSTQYNAINSIGPAMVAAGLDLHIWPAKVDAYVENHEKSFVVDGDVVISGSYNYTTSAEKSNREIMTVAYGVQVSRVLAPLVVAQIRSAYALGRVPS